MVHPHVPPDAGPRLALCTTSRNYPGALSPIPKRCLKKSALRQLLPGLAPPRAAATGSSDTLCCSCIPSGHWHISADLKCSATGIRHFNTVQNCEFVHSW